MTRAQLERHAQRDEHDHTSESRLVVDDYVDTGISCPDLRAKYDVDIREFVVLAFLRDSGPVAVESLSSAVALSKTSTAACLESLAANGLVRIVDARQSLFVPTMDGIALLRKSSELARADIGTTGGAD